MNLSEITPIFIMIQWVRIVILFRVNSFIGPFLNIMLNMLIDITKFFAIYFLILLVFASSGRIFFLNVEGYNTNVNAFITLFSATFGNFDYSVFEKEGNTLPPRFGYYFLTLFLIISNIVLLNFIIGILSSTYSRLIGSSKALYLNEIVKVRNIYEYDKYYSGLICLPAPFNILLLPIYPILIL